jgi:energy-coupling factor transporter transmembrane protein EcfT
MMEDDNAEFEFYSDVPEPKWYPDEPMNWGKILLILLICCFIFVAPVPVIVILVLIWAREAWKGLK